MSTTEERVGRLRELVSKLDKDADTEFVIEVINDLTELKSMPKVYWGPLVAQFAKRIGWDTPRFEKLISLPTKEELRWALEYRQPPPEARLPGEELYPRTGWIGRYLDWSIGDEAPLGFHFWCALGALAAVCRRNVYVDMARFVVWPNLYIILIGDPGTKKGQAMTNAMSVLSRLNYHLALDDGFPKENLIRMLPDKCTPEKAIDMIKSTEYSYFKDDGREQFTKSESHGVWFAEEMVMLMSKSAWNATGTVELLTAFFNCPPAPVIATITRGVEHLHNVSLTFVGGTTPSLMRSGVTSQMFQGGFISRVNNIYRASSKKYYFRPSPFDPIAREELVEELIPIMKWNSRRMYLTDEAEEWGDAWYQDFRSGVDHSVDEHYKDAVARRQIQALKLALLFAISEGTDAIELGHFQLAVKVLAMEEGMAAEVSNMLAAPDDVLMGDYICRVLARRGGWLNQEALIGLTKRKVGSAANLHRLLINLRAEGLVVLKSGRTAKEREWHLARPKLEAELSFSSDEDGDRDRDEDS